MSSAIVLDKVDLTCKKKVKYKPNGNDSGFIAQSHKIYFADLLLDGCGYLITQCRYF